MTTTTTQQLAIEGVDAIALTVSDRGAGRPMLLLHGGAGSQSVEGFADRLAAAEPARVLTPTHPGFGGTARPEALTTIRQLATLYLSLLDALDLNDVTVIGNSIGGWIASEMAVLGSPRISGLVLVDAVGIEVDGHPVADFFSLTLDDVARLSYHDPIAFRIDPSTMPPALQQAMAGNRASLAVYAGTGSMSDPTLRDRLGAVSVPTLVVWGDSDQIVDPDYGRAFAAAIPSARFELLTNTGHVPQIETPQQVIDVIWPFADSAVSKS